MKYVVGISDMKICKKSEDTIVTYSLGSCVGVTIYDPKMGIGGMIHCMLPLGKTDPAKASAKPSMFVDTGVSLLLQKFFNMGVHRRDMIAKVAGASNLLDSKGMFKIGERNYTILRKILWKNEILIAAEDVGGTKARTLTLYMTDGRTTVRSKGEETELC